MTHAEIQSAIAAISALAKKKSVMMEEIGSRRNMIELYSKQLAVFEAQSAAFEIEINTICEELAPQVTTSELLSLFRAQILSEDQS